MTQDSCAESKHTIRIDTNVCATAEKAYAAFTEPAQMSIWFTTSAKTDLRVGGRYDNGDGDKGEFIALEPPGKIVFTWENADHCPGTLVTVRFDTAQNDTVDVSIEHSGLASEQDCTDMTEGWTWALTSFKSYLEQGKAIEFGAWKAERAG